MIDQNISPLMEDLQASDDYTYCQCQLVIEALVLQIQSIAEQMVSKCIDPDPNQTKKHLQDIFNEGKIDLRKTVETGMMTYRD